MQRVLVEIPGSVGFFLNLLPYVCNLDLLYKEIRSLTSKLVEWDFTYTEKEILIRYIAGGVTNQMFAVTSSFRQLLLHFILVIVHDISDENASVTSLKLSKSCPKWQQKITIAVKFHVRNCPN